MHAAFHSQVMHFFFRAINDLRSCIMQKTGAKPISIGFESIPLYIYQPHQFLGGENNICTTVEFGHGTLNQWVMGKEKDNSIVRGLTKTFFLSF